MKHSNWRKAACVAAAAIVTTVALPLSASAWPWDKPPHVDLLCQGEFIDPHIAKDPSTGVEFIAYGGKNFCNRQSADGDVVLEQHNIRVELQRRDEHRFRFDTFSKIAETRTDRSVGEVAFVEEGVLCSAAGHDKYRVVAHVEVVTVSGERETLDKASSEEPELC